ncbi:GYDIA family GHMP kinase [Patiriisocius marinus]|uniref:GYDIA family GHMP kinase n=1 Tax=Patiriisocius marinus TaxID=1397112 RepID=UPI00232CC4C4|nr:GYDIA family GHMP kinase [Patiriisocius marinus]
MTKSTTYYSNGKLLLTGEYVVLDGADALAIPTKLGQNLKVSIVDTPGLHWKSFTNKNQCWFEAFFVLSTLESTSTDPVAKTLTAILKSARSLNSSFLIDNIGFEVRTTLDFDRSWGLGSSSTLINSIASWAGVDAFTLLEKSFGGSGYDIAAAQNNTPIIYTKRKKSVDIRNVFLDWDFKDSIYFVHLNKKQDSKEGISTYRTKPKDLKVIEAISAITNKLLMCYTLKDFETLMQAHETHISKLTGLATTKSRLFSDYPHTIKSLGAWGGDFILVVSPNQNLEYFRNKGYTTIIPFNEMILNK